MFQLGMIYPMLSKFPVVWGASTDIFHSSPHQTPHTHLIYYDIRNELSRANDRYCIQRPLREKSSINNKHIERTAKKCGKKIKKNRRKKKFPALGNEIKYWCLRTWARRESRKEKRILGGAAEREIFCVMNRNKFCSFNFRSMWERNHSTLENTDQVARPFGQERLITRKNDR